MIKKLLTAAAFGVSAIAMAAPAVAATQIVVTPFTMGNMNGVTGTFGSTPTQAGFPNGTGTFTFTDEFFFDFNANGVGSGSVTNNIVRLGSFATDINFTSITFNGAAGTFENVGGTSTASFTNVPLTGGRQTLVISGSSTGGASYSGEVSVLANAVPEPATWALMLMGFGLVGTSLRGRRRNVVAA